MNPWDEARTDVTAGDWIELMASSVEKCKTNKLVSKDQTVPLVLHYKDKHGFSLQCQNLSYCICENDCSTLNSENRFLGFLWFF